MIDANLAWTAFEARDRSRDGEFVGAVKTTGIYCKPSCPARHPRRENVLFFATPVEARAAIRPKPNRFDRLRSPTRTAGKSIPSRRTQCSLGSADETSST
jgi:methylphosphotriester-DNA--protein-cysteine methyltransferase